MKRTQQTSSARRSVVSKAAFGVLALLMTTVSLVTTTPEPAAAASFRGWEFTPEVSAIRIDGLALNDVSYNGIKVFERISMPAMNVFYDNNICGPYIDRIGGSSYDYEAPTEFTQNGVRWLSIGITDQIGAYVITQMFYLSENGDFDAHIFSKGLQCNIRHDHLPFLRLDFDIAGSGNDQIRRATGNGMVTMNDEFSLPATAAVNHGWEVRDTSTGDYVTIDFDDGSFAVPGTVVPETDYIENNVYGRQYKSSEERWLGGATYDLFGDGGEAMTNPVLWYNGFMPHSPAEGPSLWHSTGIRLKVHAGAAQQGTIAGQVTGASGSGVADVKVDLFTENRASFIGATTTDGSGNFNFPVQAGCYVLTFIAPDGFTMGNGGQYQNRAVCVQDGQTAGGNDANVIAPGNGAATVGDRVTNADGSGAAGVKLNLFTENRASFLGFATTDGNGSYSFDLPAAGCYVVTFIAPTGQTWADTGGTFKNTGFCAQDGDDLTDVDAVLAGGSGSATIGDRVTNSGGQGEADVKIVLYRANGDGSRGQWLRPTITDADGIYSFAVSAGCYVLDFVAPSGRTWAGTGGTFQQSSVCLSSGQTDNTIDGVLN